MVYNYVYSIPRSHFLPPFLCPSLVVCDGWLPEWRWKAKLACFRQGSCCVWCQIMCTEESEESVIKAKPPIIMSDSTVVLNPPQLVERDFFFSSLMSETGGGKARVREKSEEVKGPFLKWVFPLLLCPLLSLPI